MRDPKTKSTRWVAASLWLFVFVAVAGTTSEVVIDAGAAPACTAARELLGEAPPHTGDGPQAPAHARLHQPAGPIVQCVPATSLQRAARAFSPEQPFGARQGSAVVLLSTGLVPAAVAATLALGFLLLVRRFGFSTGLGVLASLALVFTTPVWVYGRTLGAENLIAALLVWTALSWIDAARTRRAWVLVAGGALLGACVHAHAVLVFLPLPVAAYWAWSRPGWRDAARAGALAGLGALPLLVAWFWRVHPEYGATLAFGLSAHPGLVEGWGAPALTGLYGAFLSPGKSLFLYAPLLLLGFVGLAAFWRTHRRELLLVAGIVAPLLLLFSVGWPQSSDGGWGPRAIVPLIPLLLVPAVWPMRDHRWGQRAAWLLGVLGAVVTWLGTAFDPSHFLAVVARVTRRSLRVNSGIAGQDEMLLTHFVPELNPILGHGWLSSRYLQRLRWHEESWYPWRTLNVPAWDVRTDPMPESGLNYWFDGSAAAWQLGIPVALVALVAAVLLVRAVRRAATTDAPARLARTA